MLYNPYESPHSDSAPHRGGGSLMVLFLASVARALVFLILVKGWSAYYLPNEPAAIFAIPRRALAQVLPVAIYSFPIWLGMNLRYRFLLVVVQSIVAAACFGILWVLSLDTRLTEVLYWSTVLSVALVVFSLSVEQAMQEQNDKTRHEGRRSE